MKWPYSIGLDIGIASVGWSVIALNEDAEPCGIIRLGSRIFDKAENPKDGKSLAAPRREARSMRRRLRRKALRREDLYELMEKEGLAAKEQLRQMFEKGHLEDIYALRTRALDEQVTKEEFARILLHLMQRRGFKSNRRGAAEGDDGKLLEAVTKNRERMKAGGYRTIGEMFAKDVCFADHKRNKTSEYISTVGRDMIAEEACLLFEKQREFGAGWATPELQAEYLTILLRQRNFDEGPAAPSLYRGGLLRLVGHCTLEPQELRAPKASYSFELFNLYQKVNHIRIVENDQPRPLLPKEREAVIQLAHEKKELRYSDLRKRLNLPEEAVFAGVRYSAEKSAEEAEKKEKIPPLRFYHALNKVWGEDVQTLTTEQRDEIALKVTLYKSEETLTKQLREMGLTPQKAEAVMGVGNFRGFGHISTRACQKLLPHLEQGLTYDAACTEAGYNFKAHEACELSTYLPATAPEMDEITSPVVRRAVAQTIKVVNAIIREQGHSPVRLNVELARELHKSFDERNEMKKNMDGNAAENERLMKEIRETFGIVNPTGQDLVKYRLYKEQDGRCAYSLQPLEAARLFEEGYVQVDHIVPYSISFDDRRTNKVLVLAAENQQKGNRLPLQYLTGKKREDFIVWTQSAVSNPVKRRNLLKEKISAEDLNGFRQRNLQDTQHMSRFMLNYIRDHLLFEEHEAVGKQKVTAVAGAVTAHLRKRWGLTKVREDGDTHHAMDAVVIACTTPGMIRSISGYYNHMETRYMQTEDGKGSVLSRTKEYFPAPWPHFRDELITRLSAAPQENLLQLNPGFYSLFDVQAIKPVFVSRMPRHKTKGPAHKETLKGTAPLKEGYVTRKVALAELKQDKNGEIKDYYMPASDTLLYEALKARLTAFGGDAKKAFAEPFYKPKADGTPGPLVRKVKLVEKSSLQVLLGGGSAAADNDSMVRIDVFYVPGEGYYWVPVYVADTLKKQLPNKAVVAHKPYSEWKQMQDEHFVFSLYANDLIEVQFEKEKKFSIAIKDSTLEKSVLLKKALVYYVSGNVAGGSIEIETHDGAYEIQSLGVKTLPSIRKYQVDVLGNYNEVKKEKRQSFR